MGRGQPQNGAADSEVIQATSVIRLILWTALLQRPWMFWWDDFSSAPPWPLGFDTSALVDKTTLLLANTLACIERMLRVEMRDVAACQVEVDGILSVSED